MSDTRPTVTRTVLFLTISVLLLAGQTPAAAEGPDIELDWGAHGCDFVIVLVPADADTIQQHLPAGFSPTIPDSEPLPPDPRMEAVLGYEVFQCAEQTVGRHVAQDGQYAAVWTFVEPPDELADPDRPLTFFKWRTLVPDDDQRAILRDLDVAVSDGAGDISTMMGTPTGTLFDVGFTIQDEDEVTYRATGSTDTPADFGGSFVEYSALTDRDGFAAWRTDFGAEDVSAGLGVARWDAGSFAAEVLGTTETQAWMLAGSGLAFTDATITVPRPTGDRPDHASLPANHVPDPGPPSSKSAPTARTLPTTGGGPATGGLVALATAVTGLSMIHRRA